MESQKYVFIYCQSLQHLLILSYGKVDTLSNKSTRIRNFVMTAYLVPQDNCQLKNFLLNSLVYLSASRNQRFQTSKATQEIGFHIMIQEVLKKAPCIHIPSSMVNLLGINLLFTKKYAIQRAQLLQPLIHAQIKFHAIRNNETLVAGSS